MSYDLDKRALKDPCPCTGCSYEEKCKKHELACRRFLWFIIEREWRTIPQKPPTNQMFLKIFEDDGDYNFKKFVNSLTAKGEKT
jgi:hypothetical protein